MKILVTGAKGFIGKRIVERLRLTYTQILEMDEEYLEMPDWQIRMKKTLEDFYPNVIFHVGACSDTLEKRVNYMMIRNYEATKLLADWCREKAVPLVYSSSAANYGTNNQHPSNLYGWSKYVAEDYVINAGGTALRYFNVYGRGEHNKGKMASFLFQAYQKKMNSENVLLFPHTPSRDFIYIDDVVSANIFAMKNYQHLAGRYYEVSTAVSSTFEEMLTLANIEYKYIDENEIPLGYQFYTCGDKKKWMPHWKPEFGLARGVEEYRVFLNRSTA